MPSNKTSYITLFSGYLFIYSWQCNAVQVIAVYCSAAQSRAVQCSSEQCSAVCLTHEDPWEVGYGHPYGEHEEEDKENHRPGGEPVVQTDIRLPAQMLPEVL